MIESVPDFRSRGRNLRNYPRHRRPALWVAIARLALYVAVLGMSASTILGFLQRSSLQSVATSGSAIIVLLLLFGATFLSVVEGERPGRGLAGPLVIVLLSGLLPIVQYLLNGHSIEISWLIAHAVLFLFIFLRPAYDLQILFRCLVLVMILSIGTMFLGQAAFSLDERNVFASGRLTGVLGHPNLSGMAAAIAIVVAIHLGRARSLQMALSLVVLVGSLSLTSMVCLAVGLALIATAPSRQWRNLVIFGGVAAYLAPATWVFAGMNSLSSDLFTGRVAVWEWVANQPFNRAIGEGLNVFTSHSAIGAIPWVHAHNQFLMDLASGGIVLAALTVSLFVALGKRANVSGNLLALAIWGMLLVQSITEVPLFADYFGGRLILTLVAILLITAGAQVKPASAQVQPERPVLASAGGAPRHDRFT